MTWEDKIREILQWICVWLTGSACNSGESGSLDDLVDDVIAAHQANGCPEGSDEDAKTKLEDLWDLIHDTESTINDERTTALENFIRDCYEAVGGDASTLP